MNHEHNLSLDNLKQETFDQIYKNNDDVVVFSKTYPSSIQQYSFNQQSVEIIFVMCEILIDKQQLKQTILPSIERLYEVSKFKSIKIIDNSPVISWVKVASPEQELTIRKMSNLIFEGNIICVIPSLKVIMSMNCSLIPNRTPEESSSELSIRGPKDGFVEDISINISLIRKRIRNEQLVVESFSIGTLTDTKLALLYMGDIANDKIIKTIKDRIAQIDIEQLVSIGQLEELVGDDSYFFPTMDYSSRPDFLSHALLNGRFVLILDNNPMALIAPGNFFQLLRSPEDSYFPLLASNIGHLFRLSALLLSIFIPGFYIAITTFHPDQIPLELLATISISRSGIPMEASIELFLIMTFMELFREATLRMPSNMSQTITVVGGLIMGEAAIRAGLVSPLIVVVSAISIITAATLVNQSLTSTVVFFRFIAFLFSSMLGIYGFIICYVIFILFLSRLHSFGVPYLAPLAPLSFKNLLAAIFQVPLRSRKFRPSYLHTKKTKKGE